MNTQRGDLFLKWLLVVFIGVVLVEIGALIVSLVTPLSFGEVTRIIFGVVFVLFLPGFVWTFVFFPSGRRRFGESESREISWLERLALSFALSIAIVPLVVFYANLVGVPITVWSSVFVVFLVLGIGVAAGLWQRRRARRY